MGIFTRFRDIVSANMNAMLDRAEDPQKMIRLMIREMEDTLVELKASCAGVMAQSKKVHRNLEEINNRMTYWQNNAQLAISKGRDDLAREALVEKRRYSRRQETLQAEYDDHRNLIEQYKEDIRQLENKLKNARKKERLLVQRHIHANKKRRAQQEIHRLDSSETLLKFEEFENRIERMESEAELINFGKKNSLEETLDKLADNDEIEKELQSLKQEQPPTQADSEP